MTGESEPVRKHAASTDDTADGPEQPGCLYRGTQVVDGVGTMLVTEVGDETYLGQIARRLSDEEATDKEHRVEHKLTLSKRATPLQEKLERLADFIEQAMQDGAEREISSKAIGRMVIERLRELDPVAYVRFASVYRRFEDVDAFVKELHQLR